MLFTPINNIYDYINKVFCNNFVQNIKFIIFYEYLFEIIKYIMANYKINVERNICSIITFSYDVNW